MIFRGLQRIKHRTPDHVITGIKGQYKRLGGLDTIGEALRKGQAIVPQSNAFDGESQNVEVHFGDHENDLYVAPHSTSVVWTPHDNTLPMILGACAPDTLLSRFGGGKARNLSRLSKLIKEIAAKSTVPSKASVPEFFCVATGGKCCDTIPLFILYQMY
jgi:hypothetical protein